MSEAFQPGVPMGGSELILANLRRALPDVFPEFDDPTQDKVQMVVSRPQQYELDPNRPKILWLQDLPVDPASQCLRDQVYRSQFNRIVCVSYWQQQQYNAVLGIPFGEMTVIKNAVPLLVPTFPKSRFNGKLRFIYTSTPHRGLALLAAAAEQLVTERQDWELHVYSSMNIYGWHAADAQYEPIYDRLRANPCVEYFGSQPNTTIRNAVKEAHIFAYPSIYMETSCMAIQEAMMAGCLAITTSLGALPETCAEWAWMFAVHEQPEVMATHMLEYMRYALDHYEDAPIQDALQMQSIYYQKFWSFESRQGLWDALLANALQEGPKQETIKF